MIPEGKIIVLSTGWGGYEEDYYFGGIYRKTIDRETLEDAQKDQDGYKRLIANGYLVEVDYLEIDYLTMRWE